MEAYLTWPDYTIIVILLLSVLISLVRGFVREALSLITWIVALWLSIKWAPPIGERFFHFVSKPSLQIALAFVILLIIIVIVGGIINHFIAGMIRGGGLKGMDRFLGFLFGAARGVLLVGVLVLFGNISAVAQSPAWTQAKIVPWFGGIANWLQQFLPAKLDKIEWLQTESGAQNGSTNEENIKQPSTLEKWKPS